MSSIPDLTIIQSPEAEKMRQMVTEGFYDRSRIGLWLFEVIGREYDDMAVWARTLRNEALPQTVTWSIAIWEFVYGYEPDDSLTLEYRRARIMAKKYGWPPINPAHIEAVLSELTGCPVYITENIAPYTFMVEVDESALFAGGGITDIYDYRRALKELRRIKPSHLAFRYVSVIKLEYEVTDCSAVGVAEFWREFFMEEHDIPTDRTDGNAAAAWDWWLEFFYEEHAIPTDAGDYYAGANADLLTEFHNEEIDVTTDAVSWNVGAEADLTRTHYAEADSPILTSQTNYNVGAAEMIIREFFTEDIPVSETATVYDSVATDEIVKEVYTKNG